MNPFADEFETPASDSLGKDGRRGFALTLERYYSRDAARVVVPDGTVQILPEAFRGHGEIEEIELPDTLESIGEAAFRDCSALRKIVVPDSVFEIGDRAFSGCKSLREASLPAALMLIGHSTFSRCAALEALRGGAEVYEVGSSAFSGCENLRNLPVFPHLESLGAEAFAGCSSLQVVNLPAATLSIGQGAFRNCRSLVRASIPESVESLGRNLFSGCLGLEEIEGARALVERFPDAFPRELSASLGHLRSQDRSDQVRAYRRMHAPEIESLKGEIDASRKRMHKITREIEETGVFERSGRKKLEEELSFERSRLLDAKAQLKALEEPSDEALLDMISQT